MSNVMVIGDKCKYLTFLISLKTEINLETGAPTDKLPVMLSIRPRRSVAVPPPRRLPRMPWQDYVNAGRR